MTDEARGPTTRPTVNVKMHQAYDLDVNVELLPSRRITALAISGCQPRQGAERQDKDPLDLPEETRKWLVSVNDAVIRWLAQDAANRRAFLADPLRALGEAGIEVDRKHAKALARVRESIGMAEAVAPGLQLRSLRASAKTRGRVKKLDSAGWPSSGLSRRDKDDQGCGRGNAEKGKE